MIHVKNIIGMIEYPKGGILSKELVKTDNLNVTLFCMPAGTEISEHTSTKQGVMYVLEGKGVFNLERKKIEMKRGIFIFIKKMLLIH